MTLENFVYAQKTIGIIENDLDRIYKMWLKLPKSQETIPEDGYPFEGTLASVITRFGKWNRDAERRLPGPKDWMPTRSMPRVRTKADLEPSHPARLRMSHLEFLSRIAAAFQHLNELAVVLNHLDPHEQRAMMRAYALKEPLDVVIEEMEIWYRTVERRFEDAAA